MSISGNQYFTRIQPSAGNAVAAAPGSNPLTALQQLKVTVQVDNLTAGQVVPIGHLLDNCYVLSASVNGVGSSAGDTYTVSTSADGSAAATQLIAAVIDPAVASSVSAIDGSHFAAPVSLVGEQHIVVVPTAAGVTGTVDVTLLLQCA